jgi:O-antigen ligase
MFSPFRHYSDVNLWIGIPEPQGRYDGAITQLTYVAIFFIVAHWYKPRRLDFIVFGASAIVISIIGIMQFYGMDFLGFWKDVPERFYIQGYHHIPILTTLGNPNIVSTYTVCAVLLTGFLYVRDKTKWKYFFLASSAISYWLFLVANADSGLVGILVAIVLAIPFIIQNKQVIGRTLILGASWLVILMAQEYFYSVQVVGNESGTLLMYATAFCLLVLTGAVLLNFEWIKAKLPPSLRAQRGNPHPNPEAIQSNPPIKWKLGVALIIATLIIGLIGIEILGRQDEENYDPNNLIYQAREVMHGRIEDHFGSYRAHIWRYSLTNFWDFPILGAGPDTFNAFFPREEQERYCQHHDKAHNEYLQILVSQGILGILTYLAFLGIVLVKSIPKAFKNPLVMPLLIVFIGYSAQAFFNISIPIASQMYWVFLGMLMNKRIRETAFDDDY